MILRKIVPIVIAAAMLSVVFAAADADAYDTGTYINGQYVSGDCSKDEGTEHWTYKGNTLTITADSVFDLAYSDEEYAHCIYNGGLNYPLNIVLNADLVVSGHGTEYVDNVGIYSVGAITITGTGKLTVRSSDPDNHYDEGITSDDSITIDGPTVEIDTCADLNASTSFRDTSFTMKSGTLNLIGSGSIYAGSINISGGTINVNGVRGSIQNQLSTWLDSGNVDISGGAVNFAKCNKGDWIIIALEKGSVNVHGAQGTNWKQDGNHMYAVADGPVTIAFTSGVLDEDDGKADDTPLIIGAACIIVLAAVMLLGTVLLRKR